MFLLGVRKNTILEAQDLHCRSTRKAIFVYSYKSPFENFCSRNVESFYRLEHWIISFMQIAVWDS